MYYILNLWWKRYFDNMIHVSKCGDDSAHVLTEIFIVEIAYLVKFIQLFIKYLQKTTFYSMSFV